MSTSGGTVLPFKAPPRAALDAFLRRLERGDPEVLELLATLGIERVEDADEELVHDLHFVATRFVARRRARS